MSPTDEPKGSISTSTPIPTKATTTRTSSVPSLPRELSNTSSKRRLSVKSTSSLRMYSPLRPPTPRDKAIAEYGITEVHRAERKELEADDPRRPRRASNVILHADLRDVGVLGVLLRQMNEDGVEEREKVRRLVEVMENREEEREVLGDEEGDRYEGAM
ncbi:hypothetical protein P171DRAFT_491168 [Karstenula rhodostoma CBS 690.94]|uniref:Uncharacterized protein n=1 Tax=Karstenula rhodostoma CBS 690.94 TaxID=1392251 RepID=A0A9P4U6Y9_9PLEO|nr:hypothetical protein P171DRAFT_491168 [Karstenula rhodostoma CBS 690.94]